MFSRAKHSSKAGKWVAIPGCEYTSEKNKYAHYTGKALTTLLATVNALGTVMATDPRDVELVASFEPSGIYTKSRAGTVVLAFDVKLAGQASPEQLAIFVIKVNEQPGVAVSVTTTVQFGTPKTTGVTEAMYTPQSLSDPMTCFPAVHIVKVKKVSVDHDGVITYENVDVPEWGDPAQGIFGWRQTPVFHPTFH